MCTVRNEQNNRNQTDIGIRIQHSGKWKIILLFIATEEEEDTIGQIVFIDRVPFTRKIESNFDILNNFYTRTLLVTIYTCWLIKGFLDELKLYNKNAVNSVSCTCSVKCVLFT